MAELILHEAKQFLSETVTQETYVQTLGQLSDTARAYHDASLSEATIRAYKTDIKIYETWCRLNGISPFPSSSSTIANFIAEQSKGILSRVEYIESSEGEKIQTLINGSPIKFSSLTRRIAALRYVHEMMGIDPSPTEAKAVKNVIKGIKRTTVSRPDQKKALTLDLVEEMIDGIPTETLDQLRDRALLAIGFFTAMRRSELVAIDIEHIEQIKDKGEVVAIKIHIPNSKTDQDGEGQAVFILAGQNTYCPIGLLTEWMNASQITYGPIFRRMHRHGKLGSERLSAQSVNLLIKKYCEPLGIDPKEFGGHSLRRGWITTASENDETLQNIMKQSRHACIESLKPYLEDREKLKDHASRGFK